MKIRVFYSRDLGQFWSRREDLSDLAGPYLAAALANLAAKGRAPKIAPQKDMARSDIQE